MIPELAWVYALMICSAVAFVIAAVVWTLWELHRFVSNLDIIDIEEE